MADVTLSYKGSDILELSDSGSATLKTGGKYCEDDIAVEYVKPSGGGGSAYEIHSVPFTLTQSTSTFAILHTYVKECSAWRMYPTDASNTSTNTIAIGNMYIDNDNGVLTASPMPNTRSATGVTIGSVIEQYTVNDKTYDSTRIRGSVSNKPAGAYQLDFYGVAK